IAGGGVLCRQRDRTEWGHAVHAAGRGAECLVPRVRAGRGGGEPGHGDVPGEIVKGIHLDGEWAQWHDSVLGGTDSGFQAVVTWDLGSLFKVGHDLMVSTGYQYYGPNFYPPYGA